MRAKTRTITGLTLTLMTALAISGCAQETPDVGESAAKLPIATTVDADEDVLLQLFDAEADAQHDWVSAQDATATFDSWGAANTALTANFQTAGMDPKIRIEPPTPWDTSGFDSYHMAFDAQNTGDASIQIYVEIENADGVFTNRSISIAPGDGGTYYWPIEGENVWVDLGLRENPAPWVSDEDMLIWRFGTRDPEDKSSIAAITLFTRELVRDKTLVVDNFRLRKNPEADAEWVTAIVDEYGQSAKRDFPLKVSSDDELRAAAEAELAALEASTGFADRSRFGGWKDGPQLEPTGFFRVEKVDGKWWMVDPEGHLFFSHGVANVRMANLTTLTGRDYQTVEVADVESNTDTTPEDSMERVVMTPESLATSYVSDETRNAMLTWLPEYGDELADHFSYRRSTLMGPIDKGETYNFYSANLERRYGETAPRSYMDKWVDVTLTRMNDWGFTSFGNWVDPAFYPNERVPYFANGWIIGDFKTLSGKINVWGPTTDFFDPEFERRARVTIERVAEEIQSSPWCAGIFIDNEKSWGRDSDDKEEHYGLILDALSKSAEDSPSKAVFSDYLETKYETIDALNAAWGEAYESWDVLRAGVTFETYSDGLLADMSVMLEMFGERYFKVVHDTLEDVLPNHLYMGVRMASWGMPPEVIKASVKYSDVLSFNIYREGMHETEWAFLEEIDLPVIIGEFHIGSGSDSGLYHPGLVQASSQADRARMYKAYMASVVSKPYMVGAHWFQYIDSPITGRAFDGENYNVGFVNVTDQPYQEMVDATREIMDNLYPERFGNAE